MTYRRLNLSLACVSLLGRCLTGGLPQAQAQHLDSLEALRTSYHGTAAELYACVITCRCVCVCVGVRAARRYFLPLPANTCTVLTGVNHPLALEVHHREAQH